VAGESGLHVLLREVLLDEGCVVRFDAREVYAVVQRWVRRRVAQRTASEGEVCAFEVWRVLLELEVPVLCQRGPG